MGGCSEIRAKAKNIQVVSKAEFDKEPENIEQQPSPIQQQWCEM